MAGSSRMTDQCESSRSRRDCLRSDECRDDNKEVPDARQSGMVEVNVPLAHILSQTRQNVQLLMDHDVLTEESGLAILASLQVVPTHTKNSDNPIVDTLTQQTQRLSMSPPQSIGTTSHHRVEARSNWEWPSEDPKNLSLHAGDIIEIIAETNADWWMGRNRSGKEGLFPSNYVEKLPPRELSPISVAGSSISRTPMSPMGGSGRYSSSGHAISHPPAPVPPQQQYPGPGAPPPAGTPRYYPPAGHPAVPPHNAVSYSYMSPPQASLAGMRQQGAAPSSQLGALGHTMAQPAASGIGLGAGGAIGGGVVNSMF